MNRCHETENGGASNIFRKVRTMANTSSAKKAARKIARRTAVNKNRRSRVRTHIRKVEEAVAAGDKTAALAAFKVAEPEIMRAVTRGVMHKSTASRKVSRLSASVKRIEA
jgi:small subunit ribosomal protein S20